MPRDTLFDALADLELGWDVAAELGLTLEADALSELRPLTKYTLRLEFLISLCIVLDCGPAWLSRNSGNSPYWLEH